MRIGSRVTLVKIGPADMAPLDGRVVGISKSGRIRVRHRASIFDKKLGRTRSGWGTSCFARKNLKVVTADDLNKIQKEIYKRRNFTPTDERSFK